MLAPVTCAGPVSRLQLGVGPLEIPGRQKVVETTGEAGPVGTGLA